MSISRSSYEPRQFATGLGCLVVLPAALFGTVMLMDDGGPHGWHLLAELFGWWTLCVGVSVACASVSGKLYAKGRRRISYFVVGAVAIVFLLLTIAEAEPDTPAMAKDIATAPLQPLGIVGAVWLVLFLSSMRRGSYRS